MSAPRFSNLGLMLLFSLALGTSAALMFSVQPMIGKMLLPIVGGTPAGWIVAMAFFQFALLTGYTLAYSFSRLPARGHAVAYIVTLAIGGAFLPVVISAQDSGGTIGAGGTFLLLAGSIGLPFVALATTSTTLQRLFSATDHPAARDPYFLYAASNLGSFGGLLLYPFLIEPNFTLGQQSEGWFCFYAGLVAMAIMCLLSLGHARASANSASPSQAAPLDLKRCLFWVACAFVPASLLMGYTSFITSDIYSAPLLWVLPLSIYLLTFVLAFRSPALLSSQKLEKWHIVSVGISLILIILSATLLRTSLQPIVVHLLALGVIAMTFHLRLYEDRPLGSPRQLAAFYLLLSLGGALAGIFNAFVAPFIFNGAYELPVILLLSLIFTTKIREKMQSTDYIALVLGLIAAGAFFAANLQNNEKQSVQFLLYACAFLLSAMVCNPRVMLAAGALIFIANLHFISGDIIARERNFYGNITVYDSPILDRDTGEKKYNARYIHHGTTLHGFQVLEGPEKLRPQSYYRILDEVFAKRKPRKTAVLGLGAGSMFCFVRPRAEMTFVDIDPAVIAAAHSQFTYLKDCAHDKPARIIEGDGRLELARLKGETFDLIAIDVFSSDYIPAHIATRQALDVYLDRLTDDGMILFHISNNFFDLTPVLAALAQDAGLHYRLSVNMKPKNRELERASYWFAMARDAKAFDGYTTINWETPAQKPEIRMWTDDFTDYVSIMRDDLFSLSSWIGGKRQQPTIETTTTGQ